MRISLREILFVCLLALMMMPEEALACGKKNANTGMSVEQEQQFTYCWYAAKWAIDQEQFDRALMLLTLCEHLNPNDAQTHEYLGLLYDALNQPELTKEHFRLAYENAPDDRWHNYASLLMSSQGQERKVRRQVSKMVEQVTKHRPKDVEAWDFLRQVYTSDEQYKKALKAQYKIDALIGYDGMSAIHRYQLHLMQQQPKKAVADIEHYLEFDPTDLRFHMFRIQILETIRAPWRDLEQAYREVLQLDPSNLMVMNNYAYGIATHGGDLREAERLSQRTIQAEPNNATYLDTYAWILYLQGQNTLAAFYIRKAMQHAESNQAELQEHFDIIIQGK